MLLLTRLLRIEVEVIKRGWPASLVLIVLGLLLVVGRLVRDRVLLIEATHLDIARTSSHSSDVGDIKHVPNRKVAVFHKAIEACELLCLLLENHLLISLLSLQIDAVALSVC
jgi:hypothetical protein